MTRIVLSEEETLLLKDHFKRSPLFLIRSKCQAILMRSKGIKMEDIAFVVSRDRKTIGLWLQDFDTQNMSSIFTGHQNNENASKLTKEQKEEIKAILQKPPSEQGLPKHFWDVPTLKEYTRTAFDAVYESERSYHLLLAFSNLSFKYPATFDRRRNEETIVARMKEIHKEIKPFLNDPSVEVFASDEVRIELEALTRRAWLKKGEPTVVKVDRKREAQNYIGFLNQKSFACHIYEMEWQNQEEVLKAFQLFLKEYPDKKVCIIWDNAAFHRGQKIKEALCRGDLLERVHLIALPPYAPDHNPIEHVWNEAKKNTANIQRADLKETKSAFRGYVEGRTFKYQM